MEGLAPFAGGSTGSLIDCGCMSRIYHRSRGSDTADACRLLVREPGPGAGVAPMMDLPGRNWALDEYDGRPRRQLSSFQGKETILQMSARVFRARSRSRAGEPSPSSRWRTVGGTVVALVVAGAIGVLLYLAPWEREQRPQTPADPDVDFQTYESDRGGYAFDYPSDWTLDDDGTFTRISSPGQEIIVSFGVAPSGDLLFATESLIELLRETYSPLEVEGSEVGSTSGYVSMTRSGTGTSESGEKFDFKAMVLETKARNYALLSFDSAEQASEDHRSLADTIIDSFRLV